MSEANGFVGRDAFLARTGRRFSDIEVTEFGKVRIRSLTELERSRYESTALDKKGNVSPAKLVDMKCRLIVLCVVDGSGNPIFNNSDIQQIQSLDSKITNAVVDAIRKHCGISNEDIEELEKKTDSPEDSSP